MSVKVVIVGSSRTGIINRIIGAIQPKPDDHLVEIGPRAGRTDRVFVASSCQLDVAELDTGPGVWPTDGLRRQTAVCNTQRRRFKV